MVENSTVLVVVAHPDDAENYCGGTIRHLALTGNRVTLVVCTNGNRGTHSPALSQAELAQIRRKEQELARRVLGFHHIIWLDYPDGTFEQTPGLLDSLVGVIR
jgi:N,N'-diacetylchitobiose non-reducing end deacetylase